MVFNIILWAGPYLEIVNLIDRLKLRVLRPNR